MLTYILLVVIVALLITVLIVGVKILRSNTAIADGLQKIAQGERLSTILEICPASLTIDPADFEPKRDALLERLLKSLAIEKHPSPETQAYCVLEHSGFGAFVDGKTFQAAKKALGRLLTNGDIPTARKFLSTVVDQL